MIGELVTKSATCFGDVCSPCECLQKSNKILSFNFKRISAVPQKIMQCTIKVTINNFLFKFNSGLTSFPHTMYISKPPFEKSQYFRFGREFFLSTPPSLSHLAIGLTTSSYTYIANPGFFWRFHCSGVASLLTLHPCHYY